MSKSSLNPAWPHYVGALFVIIGLFIGVARFLIHGWADAAHCSDLLNRGSWLDGKFKVWQPEGCILHSYKDTEASTCLRDKEVLFIGDSVTRKLFFQTAGLLDPSLPTAPSDSNQKHANHTFATKSGVTLNFVWDPFLNTSVVQNTLQSSSSSDHPAHPRALVVLGSGLWYLRYANISGGISAWEANIHRIFGYLLEDRQAADNVVILPVEEVVTSKLSKARAETMRSTDIDAMNSELYYRINPINSRTPHPFARPGVASQYVSLPLVFNHMLDESLTEDGLHFSDDLVKSQAQILLNLHCNDAMPKTFPFNKTCCYRYPTPSFPHFLVLFFVTLSGPFILHKTFPSALSALGSIITSLPGSSALPPLIISASIALIYLADRTGFWLKEQKLFDPWSFGGVCVFFLACGLATLTRSDSDLGFLNRDQTDEWKGWMQILILIYHYFGASKISGIYNPVRVLVASYLFMTGYGHTMFYLRKADFGFTRVAQVLIRVNLYTILLAYSMNTDYISYYFTPLVSMWYIIVYLTLSVGARFNDRVAFVLLKISLSAGAVTWFMRQEWLLGAFFSFLERIFAIHWSAREWGFRVNLDIWAVYVGMVAGIAVIKAREYRLTDRSSWATTVKISIVLSILTLIWFFCFELYQASKFAYNLWHPYISFLPILSFIILRNATAVMRSVRSRLFAFMGKCSLEAFIIQFHFWLAGDSKGVLLVLPGTRWRPFNFVVTTIMFTFLCDRVAFATGEITSRLCSLQQPSSTTTTTQHMPLPVTSTNGNGTVFSGPHEGDGDDVEEEDEDEEGQEIAMNPVRTDYARKGVPGGGEVLPPEPDTPIRPRRWLDQLANSTAPTTTSSSGPSRLSLWLRERGVNPGLKMMVGMLLGVMWFFNLVWVYPPIPAGATGN